MSHNPLHVPAPCPVCGDSGGFHFGHRFQVPDDWRALYSERAANDGWIIHTYEDAWNIRHRVVTKEWAQP